MRAVEVVFEEEFKYFGLEIGEIVEIVREVANKQDDIEICLENWDENGKLRFAIRMKPGYNYLEETPHTFVKKAVEKFNKFIEDVESRLYQYRKIKPFLHIYSKNNGVGEVKSNQVRDLFEKAGIEVIS